jgi:hypothetical protein
MKTAACRFSAVTLLLLPALLAGCAGMKGASSMNIDFSKYAHQVTDGTVALYWNCTRPSPGIVRIEGVANNPWVMSPLQDLLLRFYGYSAQGATLVRASTMPKEYWIQPNAPSPFTVNLETKEAVAKVDLAYSYMLAAIGGGGGRGGGGGSSTSAEHQNTANNVCAGLAP